MKQYLVTEIDTGDGCHIDKEVLPPNGKWLTREQVKNLVSLAKIAGFYEGQPHQWGNHCNAKNAYIDVLNELFGPEEVRK